MLLTKSIGIEATNSSHLKEATQAFTAEYKIGESSINQLNSNSRETSHDMLNGFHNVSINRGFTTFDPNIHNPSTEQSNS